ncbi:MAG TPA: ThuA domain-containing protein [Vicinamibacterales bacterium]|jgi:type 1 glutamine amidotransferase|nr:ThuA domain-containing protein [Vicinamibacterales bacterium]
MRVKHLRHLVFVATMVVFVMILAPVDAPARGRAFPVGSQAEQKRSPKTVLILGATRDYQHDSISDAMVALSTVGKASGAWDSYLRTDFAWITKSDAGRNGKNLTAFDAIVLVSTTGPWNLTDEQRRAFLSFVHDDGKGLVAVHAALDANYDWPEYAEMLGGWFDGHPWDTFDAPIVLEDPSFPAVKHLPRAFSKRDEIYQAKAWSRDKVNVLLRLDETKLPASKSEVRRSDRDFGVAWAKTYGRGRVFYSTLGHTKESWSDPDVTTMYGEAIRWVLGLSEGSTASHGR